MAHLIITAIRTIAPGGARAVIAESLLLKHQLLDLNRSRKKAPRLRALDRVLLGLSAILVSPQRIVKAATAIRPATLLRFYRALVRQKYQWLFFAKTTRRRGPKGPSKEPIAAVSRSNASIRALVALASPSKFRSPSAWRSTRTWCAGSLRITLRQNLEARVHRGCLSLLNHATAYGTSIFFAASPSC